jgi:hypothetical protein
VAAQLLQGCAADFELRWPIKDKRMSKVFQVYEEDLGELEQTLPQLAQALTPVLNNKLRVQLRRCQSILSNIRWEYGPPTEVEKVPADGE